MSKYNVKVSQWRITDADANTPEHQEIVGEWVDVVEADNAANAKRKVFDGYGHICDESQGYEEIEFEVLGEVTQ